MLTFSQCQWLHLRKQEKPAQQVHMALCYPIRASSQASTQTYSCGAFPGTSNLMGRYIPTTMFSYNASTHNTGDNLSCTLSSAQKVMQSMLEHCYQRLASQDHPW